MIYREWLVMRKAVLVFVGVVVALTLLFDWAGAARSHMQVTFVGMFSSAAWFTAIFASIFGVALGNGSREGARVFWILPKARWRSALEVIGVDFAGIAVAFSCVVVASVALNAVFAALYPSTASMHWNFDWHAALAAVLMPLAVYAWSALVGMLGRRIPYVGLAVMPVLMIWFGLAQADTILGQVLRAPIATNPIVVYEMQSLPAKHDKDFGPFLNGLLWMTPDIGLAVLIAIAIVGCATAIALWQRSEVLA